MDSESESLSCFFAKLAKMSTADLTVVQGILRALEMFFYPSTEWEFSLTLPWIFLGFSFNTATLSHTMTQNLRLLGLS